MENDKAAVDPLPETFDSFEKMADFWDTHDVTDYAEYLTPVEMTIAEHPRAEYVITLSDTEDDLLQRATEREGVPLTALINAWVQEKLQEYAAS
ncbi:MAG: hypothetical protein HY328_04955 [Chloroflexi bacterium]|nr:hypothetical protein [Chloroflexota bacterium]